MPPTRAAERCDRKRGAASSTDQVENDGHAIVPGTGDGTAMAPADRAAALEADAHLLLARGHALLAEAVRARGAAAESPDALVSIARAAGIAATSERVLREAIRSGALPAYGGQRDRAVRMRDLSVWIESRRVTLRGPADRDIERRMRRLARQGAGVLTNPSQVTR